MAMGKTSDFPPPGSSRLRVFSLKDSCALGDRVCGELGVATCAHEEREFDDGEHTARPLVNVRGCDVYVVLSLHGDQQRSGNDKLCRLLFFIGALKDAGGTRVTVAMRAALRRMSFLSSSSGWVGASVVPSLRGFTSRRIQSGGHLPI
jgi:hypothetical protein